VNEIGVVESIHVAPAAGEPMRSLDRARAMPGAGLEGDRYADGTGHWSPMHRSGDGLTLIDATVVDGLAARRVPRDGTRRNVVVRGIDLDGLIGRTFRIGDVTCRAIRRCEPCSYLDGLLETSVLNDLVHRGGIRAEIVSAGWIEVGDPVAPVDIAGPREDVGEWQTQAP
jgi:MOSC domain-containing protein YiiM